MSGTHASYEEIDSPATLRADAAAAGRALHLGMGPSPEYGDTTREATVREIAVDESATRIANALHLHLD
ncbi:MAG TPA: hypothetical protein VFI21_13820 [Nocardioides sp.]|jgi:hypothetical protein|nr:hypothetical protein [Nocardioides sp.]